MSEVDYAAIGRVAAERKETKDRLGRIKGELSKAGHLMTQLGSALTNSPSGSGVPRAVSINAPYSFQYVRP